MKKKKKLSIMMSAMLLMMDSTVMMACSVDDNALINPKTDHKTGQLPKQADFVKTVTEIGYITCDTDEDGVVVYTTYVPAGTTMIVLPSTLSGDFEIRLVGDTYYYRGYITL